MFYDCKKIGKILKEEINYRSTINKSQGRTMSVCSLDLGTPCFLHGLVVCSHVGKLSNLFLLTKDGLTKNIVPLIAL